MRYCFPISFFACQSCSSHSYCRSCCASRQADLQELPGLQNVTIDSEKKLLSVKSDIDKSALIDLLEDKGIFVEE